MNIRMKFVHEQQTLPSGIRRAEAEVPTMFIPNPPNPRDTLGFEVTEVSSSIEVDSWERHLPHEADDQF